MVFTTGKLGRLIDGASQSGLEESPSAHNPVAPPQEDLEPVAVQVYLITVFYKAL